MTKKIMISLIGLLLVAAAIVLSVLFADKGEAAVDTLAVSSVEVSSELSVSVSSDVEEDEIKAVSSQIPVSSVNEKVNNENANANSETVVSSEAETTSSQAPASSQPPVSSQAPVSSAMPSRDTANEIVLEAGIMNLPKALTDSERETLKALLYADQTGALTCFYGITDEQLATLKVYNAKTNIFLGNGYSTPNYAPPADDWRSYVWSDGKWRYQPMVIVNPGGGPASEISGGMSGIPSANAHFG